MECWTSYIMGGPQPIQFPEHWFYYNSHNETTIEFSELACLHYSITHHNTANLRPATYP